MQIGIQFNPFDPVDLDNAVKFFSAATGAAVALPQSDAATETTRRSRRSSKDETPKEPGTDDFVVFNADGGKRAGFAHSKDAADVVIFAAQQLTTHAELSKFGEHNLKTIARLDKEDQARVQAAITAHVAKVKEAEANPTSTTGQTNAPAEANGSGAASSSGSSAPTAEIDPLAAAFGVGGPVPETPTKQLSRDDYIKEMLEISKALGPQAAAAWVKDMNLGSPLDAPEDRWVEIVEKGKAHVTKLKSGA